jgi:hypothetical protein
VCPSYAVTFRNNPFWQEERLVTMSPLSPEPDPYQQPYLQPLRPRSLTVIGVLGIIFGAGGVFCLCLGLAGNLVKLGPQQPQFQLPMVDMILGIASAVVGLLISLMLIIGCVGTLNLKPWSRGLMIVIAGVDLIFEFFRLIVGIVHTIPMTMDMLQNHMPPDTPADQVQKIQSMMPVIKGFSYGMTIAIFVVQVAYMISVILVMNSQKERRALAEPGAEPPPGPPA